MVVMRNGHKLLIKISQCIKIAMLVLLCVCVFVHLEAQFVVLCC